MKNPFRSLTAGATLILLSAAFCQVLAAGTPVFETPDLRNLQEGAHALKKGSAIDAISNFEDSARYGNKAAQKMLGMIYVKGLGVDLDWPLGFAWLKLAATHGDPEAVSARDQVLAQLKPDEVPLARERFEEINLEFGDQAAVERREAWIRKEKRKITGSRTGKSSAVRIQVADATGYTWQVAGAKYFELLQGSYVLEFRQRMGEVTYGELEVIDEDP
ncbi:MAG: hypothetical protein AB8B96_02820 [Lysobacterales bacterium]